MVKTRLAAYYHPSGSRRFSQADFEALLGHPVPDNAGPKKGQYTLNTPLVEMTGSFIGRQLYKMMNANLAKMVAGKEDTPTGALILAMGKEMPMRSMLMGGQLDLPKLEALLLMINGHFLRGLLAFLKKR